MSDDDEQDDEVVFGSDELEAANAIRDQILPKQDVQIPYEIELEYDWDAGNFQYTLRTGQAGEMKSFGIVEPTRQGDWNAVEQ